MQKSLKLLPLMAALSGALFAMGARAEGLDYHGYTRVGAGGTTKGGNLQCFGGGWPIRAKYRLGNECDNYSEHSMGLGFGDTNEVWAKYNLRLALQDKGTEPDNTIGDGFNLLHRENFFEAGGFFGRGSLENAKVWIGKRFYNRHDIHMNDYFYWNNSGNGAGIEEINAGPAKLAFAYLQNSPNAGAFDSVNAKRYALRFYDITLADNLKLEGEFVAIKGSSADPSKKTGSGSQLFLQLTQSGVLGGSNAVAIVSGKDLGGDGFEWLPTYAGGGEVKATSFRIHDHLHFDLKGTNISGTATATYAKVTHPSQDDLVWTSFGIRPQYNFSKNVSVALEIGHDEGKNGASKPKLDKITIAPQLALSPGVWARPVLRAFVTHANWNADAGTQANGVFGAAKSGTTFGVQAEAWW